MKIIKQDITKESKKHKHKQEKKRKLKREHDEA